MNDNNVKKRKSMTYDEFIKNKSGIEKGENDIANKSYSGDKNGDAGVATLEVAKKIRAVKENYEIDFEADDFATEHAKAVLDAAFEAHKTTGKIDMKKAFEVIAGDFPKFDSTRNMVYSSLLDLLDDISNQVKKLK